MFEFDKPYSNAYGAEGIKIKKRPAVLHHHTCPDCGRKLVNLYYSAQLEKYLCKKCMEESKECETK